MGAFSIWHWLIVLVVVLVLFGGKGKISSLMGDFGKGLKSFKKGMKEEEDANPEADIAASVQNTKSIKSEEVDLNTSTDLKKDKAASS